MEKFVQTANIWSKRIASGMYNAGQIDFRTDENGTVELVKVNNHVWKTSKNNVEPERILESMEFWYNICNLSPPRHPKNGEVWYNTARMVKGK